MRRFVKPEVARLPLTEGDYIDVKKRLTHGEQEDLFAKIAPYTEGGKQLLDRREVRTATVQTYLVGWSLTNDGNPVPMSPELPASTVADTLRSLSPETFKEIYDAITAHEIAMDAELEAEKKSRAGAIGSPATSPSPSDATGPTTT